MPKVIILVGCPGAGKSTWISKIPTAHKVCSADHFFCRKGEYEYDAKLIGVAHKVCFQNYMAAIAAKEELIIIDNTNTRARERRGYVWEALQAGYEVYLKVFPVPDKNRNIHGVPWDKVLSMAAKIDLEPGFYRNTWDGEKNVYEAIPESFDPK
jgi:predicted kinase